ncbi:MAG: hypothetical protein JXQ25_03570 [Deltaproteobacteria bacterium]|nr:hypothetical protein [Deltaproteobacteria bacterium]
MTVFDMEWDKRDPLDSIQDDTGLIQHMRKNGIDGLKVNEILSNSYGLKMEMPISVTEEDREREQSIDYDMRRIKALVNGENTTGEEKDFLCKIMTRLYQDKPITWERNKKGEHVVNLKRGHGDAKSLKQVWGLQTVELYTCLRAHITNRFLFKQRDVFYLIAHLLQLWWNVDFTEKHIATFYKNNKKKNSQK